MNLHSKTITELLALLQAKEVSATEITKTYLERIKQENSKINAFVTVTESKALEMAAASDQRYKDGNNLLLDGIPIGIKDLFCTKGIKTQAASKILDNFIPTYESTVTQNLWDNGAVNLGKLNMDEFAMGSANLNSCYGEVVNPLQRTTDDKKLVPGGSSGGSSAAVAADFCAAATGSDTGGSVRQPAAFTGTVGIKPTYGRCSRWGMVAFASSLDQAGAITKSVEDAALFLEVISGYDKKDSTSQDIAVPNYSQNLQRDLKGLKIGIPKEYNSDLLNSEAKDNWSNVAKLLADLGAEIIDISLPHTDYAAPTYYIISTAEASSNLARYDGVKYGLRIFDKGDSLDEMYEKTRQAGFGPEVKKRILTGTYVLSAGYYDAYYQKALKLRSLISQDFQNAYKNVDLILTPTTPNTAFAFDERPDTINMYLNDIFTVSANLAGLPAISLPTAIAQNGLPLAAQLIGNSFQEELLLQTAHQLEGAIQFDKTKLKMIV
ncbi:MAG: Asp-tRNA(Asn)/Glu-tRNA(Gln) amidotransferase subunit GatA [Rickettsiales bacterium]|jgi:aspartyl-tRNA(Asn)/glutamyl-tRNA(Gln) amidotransferase subunit A|nr:Asp-tRNA(Asn)/Glu-tRNA(Gln) amidotransferase subunit GatA [Rickettsiales bacterium]